MRQMFAITLSVSLLCAPCWADNQKPLTNQKDKESYAIGYELGGNLRNQKVEVDINVLIRAINDGLEGSKPALDPEDARSTMHELQRKMLVGQNQRKDELTARNKGEGKAFLAKNRGKEGIRTLSSGLQYRVLHDGTGPAPLATDKVKVNYRGMLINGTEFDSSYSRGKPRVVDVSGVNSAWTEALQLMKTGSKWQIFVPSELAYGERQYGGIPPNSTVIYELELLSIEKDEKLDGNLLEKMLESTESNNGPGKEGSRQN